MAWWHRAVMGWGWAGASRGMEWNKDFRSTYNNVPWQPRGLTPSWGASNTA